MFDIIESLVNNIKLVIDSIVYDFCILLFWFCNMLEKIEDI